MQVHRRGIITIPPRNRQSTEMAFLVFSVCARTPLPTHLLGSATSWATSA